jgi:hypothetical protein
MARQKSQTNRRNRFLAGAAVAFLAVTCACSNSEADMQAKQYWSKEVKNCGGIYYRRNGNGWFAYKDFSYHLYSSGLTEADKLNGFEWKGGMLIESSAHREWNPFYHRWTDWTSGNPTVAFVGAIQDRQILVKKSGRWYLGPFSNIEASKYNPPPINCSAVP